MTITLINLKTYMKWDILENHEIPKMIKDKIKH